jgi:uncharacterized protein
MLLDTSGLLCLLHRAELCHDQARVAYKTAKRRTTHDYIIAELIALATVRRLPRQIVLPFVSDLLDNPDIETVWVEESLHREALELLSEPQDRTYSLCDAVSFLLMRKRDESEALTTDHHFEQEGFRKLLT